MLFQKVKIVTTISLFLLCSSGYFVSAIGRSCYHCDNPDACKVPDSHECSSLDNQDECFVLIDEQNEDISRMGCRSEFDSESEIVDLIKNRELWFCKTDNCNGLEYYSQNFPINSCVDCNSHGNEACDTDPDLQYHTSCSLVPYTQCFERAIIEEGFTLRGCLHDLMPDQFYDCLTGADPNCRVCNGDGCNDEANMIKKLLK